jgi:prostaglandin-endoperoxide synthase 2
MSDQPRPPLAETLPRLARRLGASYPRLGPGASSRLPGVLGRVTAVPALRRAASATFINYYAYATPPRPRALTMHADYTTWTGLNDAQYTGRHLPPASAETVAGWPDEQDVVALFRREQETPSTDTSVWFMFFAQWFTDSFLRTSREDFRRNTSTQNIDLCQIYGLGPRQTRMLRSGHGGRLKSQLIDDQEFPHHLLTDRADGEPRRFRPEFEGLHDERFVIDTVLGGAADERSDQVFAVGLEHGNATIGNTLFNVLFLREHNRVAGLLAGSHPDWDDDRLFETTRNVLIVLLLKVVVEDYIRHIGPFDFALEAVPFIADKERWNRPNRIAIEFNLLYRWHSLVPESIGTGDARLRPGDFLNNNALVVERGFDALVTLCSQSPAAKIGLFNTPAFLVDRSRPDHPSLEERTVALMRKARLASYNDYRASYGLRRMRSYEELTTDAHVRERLVALYGPDIDALEWYVGIFAEDYPDYLMMGDLLMTMVANDAFTQALTNPLLARSVFTADTFSPEGLEVITTTGSLADIVARNAGRPDDVVATFTCAPSVG